VSKTGIIFDIKRYAVHDGPGIRTTVFLKGCVLACPWCHNPEGKIKNPQFMWKKNKCIQCKTCVNACPNTALSFSGDTLHIDTTACDFCRICVEHCPSQALEIVGMNMSVPQVIKEIEKDILFYDQSKGGVTFSGGEPLMQPDFLYNLLKACKTKEIHTAVDTSGYAKLDTFSKISKYTDLFLYDIKMIDNESHIKYTGVSNTHILKNLMWITTQSDSEVIIRIPIIPGVNDTKKHITDIGEFISSLPVKKVDILLYHKAGISKGIYLIPPVHPFQCETISADTLTMIKEKFNTFNIESTIGG
jgi:pyruvate formate lyase activating enzyme